MDITKSNKSSVIWIASISHCENCNSVYKRFHFLPDFITTEDISEVSLLFLPVINLLHSSLTHPLSFHCKARQITLSSLLLYETRKQIKIMFYSESDYSFFVSNLLFLFAFVLVYLLFIFVSMFLWLFTRSHFKRNKYYYILF